MRSWWLVAAATGCGSSAPKPAPEPPPAVVKKADPSREEIVAAHRKLEVEQQEALALTCTEPGGRAARPRCTPTCYPTELPDPRAAKHGATIAHVVCGDAAPYLFVDELATTKPPRAARPHAKKSPEGALEAALAAELRLPRGDSIVVTGTWHAAQHPISKEPLRCIDMVHVAKHPIDACGTDGALACEASGNQAVRGINVVHFNLAVAREMKLQNHGDTCREAALEAIAVARGLPRWRQYVKLNAGTWKDHPGYRTRFDGVLDEDALFAAAASLGNEAEQLYGQCGGADPKTTPQQEQSFHGCW